MSIGIRSLTILGVTLAIASITPGNRSAYAATFANGSFEMGINPGQLLILPDGSTSLPGWTVVGGTIDYIGSLWDASDGSRSLDLSGMEAGRIEQTFDTILGARYQVLFDLAGNPESAPVERRLRVAATGSTAQDYSFDATGKRFTAMGWQTMAYNFTAISSSTTLLFTSLTNTPYGPALDNVRVTVTTNPPSPTHVPTPALLPGLIGMGLVVWCWRGRGSDQNFV